MWILVVLILANISLGEIIIANETIHRDGQIHCNSTLAQECTIICNTTSSCSNANIYCNPDTECTVQCSASSACRSVTIHWPDDQPYELTCIQGCSYIEYVPYFNGINPITFNCTNDDACTDSKFWCPESAICNLNCIGIYSCYYINATIPSSSFMNIICDGEQSCLWGEFNGPGLLTCNDTYSCGYATFPIPPPDKPLEITCSAYQQCFGATIYCPTDANCTIICGVDEGRATCDQTYNRKPMIIKWPINPLYRPPMIDCPPPNDCTGTHDEQTYSPTGLTLTPSLHPTASTSNTVNVISTYILQSTAAEDIKNVGRKDDGDITFWHVIVMAFVVIMLCVAVLCFVIVYKLRKDRNVSETEQNVMVRQIEIQEDTAVFDGDKRTQIVTNGIRAKDNNKGNGFTVNENERNIIISNSNVTDGALVNNKATEFMVNDQQYCVEGEFIVNDDEDNLMTPNGDLFVVEDDCITPNGDNCITKN